MKKLLTLFLIGSVSFSCHYDESMPGRPCYSCHIAETFQGVTNSSYWDVCGQANVATFIQGNTYQYAIIQQGLTYQLYRVTTCQPK